MTNIKITAFWDITPQFDWYQCTQGTCRIFRVEDSSAVKDAAISSKMLVSIYKTNTYIW